MVLIDAHCHLQDKRLDSIRDDLLTSSNQPKNYVVNGTSPADWKAVKALATEHESIVPSFGLHPWKVNDVSDDWLLELRSYLESSPHSSIGEVGIDKWIRGIPFEKQISCFRRQLELSIEFGKPCTIHCLKAWRTLREVLGDYPELSDRGFLLHSYSGPGDWVDSFVEKGAYFSISGYFFRPEKASKLEVWQNIPRERLLIETDAPDMAPPASMILEEHLLDSKLNHPLNLASIYNKTADLLKTDLQELELVCERNFERLFTG